MRGHWRNFLEARTRRGSKSSWLLTDPLAQSWPVNVVPSTIISSARITTSATPVPSVDSEARLSSWCHR